MARTMTDRSSARSAVLAFVKRVRTDDAGFTLAEALVSFVLFMIVSTAAVFGLVQIIRLTGVNRSQVAAANVATRELECIRNLSNTSHLRDLPGDPNPPLPCKNTVTLHGTTYTVTPAVSPGVNTDCAAGQSRQVSVTVSWNDSPSRSVRYDSELAC